MSNPSNPLDRNSRVAELVQELVGAQMLARMVDELWTLMRPEMKEAIAEAIGVKALKSIQEGSQVVNNALYPLVGSVVMTDDFKAKVIAAVNERIDREWERSVSDVSRNALESILRDVRARFR